jgi:hypothetical protein
MKSLKARLLWITILLVFVILGQLSPAAEHVEALEVMSSETKWCVD